MDALFSNALHRLEALLGLSIEIIEPASIFVGGNPDDDSLTIIGAEQVQQIGRWRLRSHAALFDERFLECMKEAAAITLDKYIAARRRRFTYARQLDSLLAGDCLLAAPTVIIEGWTPDGRIAESPEIGLPNAVVNTAVHNLTGHAAISLPAGVGPHGIPFGLMLTAPRFRDDLLLDLAQAWEAAEPWPAAAPGYSPFVPPESF
jgi:amidase/aspartyl-tRNA(Asn)/glutamyl-tRNA(Gln) amidotransferase subunit A